MERENVRIERREAMEALKKVKRWKSAELLGITVDITYVSPSN